MADSTCGKSGSDNPTKDKPGPDVTIIQLEGVDTATLTTREKKEWSSYVGEFLSPCQNVPVPLAQCVKEKRDCPRCLPAAKFVVRGVKDGKSREQIEEAYKNRFAADKVKTVPVDGSPLKGSEGAPVTIVEFADFQCPHCADFMAVLDKAIEGHKNDVRFYYKLYNLGKFPQSDLANRAAAAAWRQNKFWEMHHALFLNQQALSQQKIDDLAQQMGLDVGRLHADMQANETTTLIARDKKQGEDLLVRGTPSIWINGRQYDGSQELSEWIGLEVQLAGKSGDAPAPSAAADAGKPAPSGSTSAPAGSSAAPHGLTAPPPSVAPSAGAPKK